MLNPKKQTRNEVVRHVMAKTGIFTMPGVMAELPDVPRGTVNNVIHLLHHGGALRLVQKSRGHGKPGEYTATTKMPKTVKGARLIMARARVRNGSAAVPRRRRGQKPEIESVQAREAHETARTWIMADHWQLVESWRAAAIAYQETLTYFGVTHDEMQAQVRG